jgi:hypothetical protein
MILPDNCSFAALPPNPLDLLPIGPSNCCRLSLPSNCCRLSLPSNCCRLSLLGTEEPLCRSRATEDEAYRFFWNSSFDGRAMVCVGCKGDAVALRWNWGRVITDQKTCGTMALPATDWSTLCRALDAAKFWSLDASENRRGLDGADWLIEGRHKDIYHAVRRWSPYGEIHDLGRLFFAMAGSPLAGVKLY